MSLFKVVKKQISSEKVSVLSVVWTYWIVVSPDFTKTDIKNAFKKIYNLELEKVRILNVREKFKYAKKWTTLKRRSFKKAYVTLKDKNASLDLTKF